MTEVAVRRFGDLDIAARDSGASAVAEFRPLRITVSEPLPPAPLPVTLSDDQVVEASLIDGWHRLFAAQFADVPTLPAVRVHEAYPTVPGRIEHVGVDADGHWNVVGWAVDRLRPWVFAELRACGTPLARVEPAHREDLVSEFPDVPHAAQGGFSFRCPAPPDDCDLIDVLPMRDWLPVGRIRLRCPPSARSDPGLVALATGIGEAIRQLGSLASLDGAVLAAGRTLGQILAELLPAAEVAPLEGSPGEWADVSETGLIVLGDALAPLSQEARENWLDEGTHLLRAGGIVLVRDRQLLPTSLPASVRELARFAPEPVHRTEAAALIRAG